MRHKLILLVVIVLVLLVACKPSEADKPKKYEWNNGYCIECGGKLRYSKTGSKEHYICEDCGKEYTFDKVMSKK